MSAAKDAKSRTPWRDNIEAMSVAIIMAVMFKYFALEAYQIPTGSMQPTLMGQDFPPEPPGTSKPLHVQWLDKLFGAGGSIKDRILVDKLSFHVRDPERWEVVIFKYPLNRAQNFVKRLVGMPGEHLRIAYGDIWRRANAGEAWSIVRRPEAVLDTQWKALDVREPKDGVHWARESTSSGTAQASERSLELTGDVDLRFAAHGNGAILDTYSHGYTPGIQAVLPPHSKSNRHEVGDLRFTGRVRAQADFRALTIELRESGRLYQFEIPGPAAPADASARVVAGSPRGEQLEGTAPVAAAFRLPANEWIEVCAQNLDDRLTLELDGDVLAELDVPPCDGRERSSGAYLRTRGGSAQLDELQVWRDIYYTESDSGVGEWQIPEGHYFMLGDNTQDSSDSREWSEVSLRWRGMPPGHDTISGNLRASRTGFNLPPDANPVERRIDDTVTVFFRDAWGELWSFPKSDEQLVPPPLAQSSEPFVPRNLIAGRAVAVFWPLSIKYSTYRWKWVR